MSAGIKLLWMIHRIGWNTNDITRPLKSYNGGLLDEIRFAIWKIIPSKLKIRWSMNDRPPKLLRIIRISNLIIGRVTRWACRRYLLAATCSRCPPVSVFVLEYMMICTSGYDFICENSIFHSLCSTHIPSMSSWWKSWDDEASRWLLVPPTPLSMNIIASGFFESPKPKAWPISINEIDWKLRQSKWNRIVFWLKICSRLHRIIAESQYSIWYLLSRLISTHLFVLANRMVTPLSSILKSIKLLYFTCEM